jgi:hypothetical protein
MTTNPVRNGTSCPVAAEAPAVLYKSDASSSAWDHVRDAPNWHRPATLRSWSCIELYLELAVPSKRGGGARRIGFSPKTSGVGAKPLLACPVRPCPRQSATRVSYNARVLASFQIA